MPPADPVLDQLFAAPFRLCLPAGPSSPFIFAVPHAGRVYPPSFLAVSRLDARTLRRSEDAFSDELFEGVAELGCPLIAACFPRAYVDANRAPTEIDAGLFDGPLTVAADPPGPRVGAGLGVIPRVVRDGIEIYAGKLPAAEAEQRLARLYHPYHTALAGLVEETRRRFGCAVVVDCHSMPSLPRAAEIVFGDCHGSALSPALMRHIEHAFAAAGFATARNTPYSGGHTTRRYARRDEGVQAVQIEVNRGLYLDEDRVEKTAGFAAVKGRLTAALGRIVGYEAAALQPRRPLAAE